VEVISEVPLSTSVTVIVACGTVAPEVSFIVPAMLPASFWLQTLGVSSNEKKQMETNRNGRRIGLLSSHGSVPNRVS
jgi:hypothetical protein